MQLHQKLMQLQAVLLSLLTKMSLCTDPKMFPVGFKFGVATASYQIEGAWNESGKGENIWDHFTHTHPELITDHSTGDVACDSYHLWQEDLSLLLHLKVDFYRFSLSWSRILPSGFSNKVNPDGIRYYNMIIDDLIANNIEPMVTIYHWDLPKPFQDLGGWPNPLMADYFLEYADVVFSHFGDRVKKWITFNEPSSFCVDPYESGLAAPGVYSPGIGTYLCAKTMLLAHARAYRLYDSKYRNTQFGKVGITIDSIWAEPKTNKSEDIAAAEREMEMSFGIFANPIFSKNGDYPEILKARVSNISQAEGYVKSRLPELSNADINLIQGTHDFFGLNHYHTYLVENHEHPTSDPSSFSKDKGTKLSVSPDWMNHEPTIVPWGFRKLINWVKNHYNNPLVYITENGYYENVVYEDNNRILYLKGYMKALLDAIIEDGCNVNAYTVWSVMDNFEWVSGYTRRFGLNYVDFNSPNKTRSHRMSAFLYKRIILTRIVPP